MTDRPAFRRQPPRTLALTWTNHARQRMAERYGASDHAALTRVETVAARGFDVLLDNEHKQAGTVRVCVQMLDGPLWLVLDTERLVVITVFGHLARTKTGNRDRYQSAEARRA